MNGEQDKNEGGSAAKLPPSLIEKVSRAVRECGVFGPTTFEELARAAAAVVVKEQLEWVSDKAHENCEQGLDLWDWKATLDAAIRTYAREKGIEL